MEGYKLVKRGTRHNSEIGLSLLIKTIILFLYIYEFNMSSYGFPSYITSRRLVVVFLLGNVVLTGKLNQLIIFSKKRLNVIKRIRNINLLFVIYLIFSFFLLLFVGRGTGSHMVDNSIRLLLFGIVGGACLAKIFSNPKEMMMALLLATLLQSVIVVYGLLNPSFHDYLDTHFTDDIDRAEHYRGGYALGLACMTAPGCLRFSVGFISLVYFYLSGHKVLSVFLLFIFAFVATMIARTGLVLGLTTLFFIIVVTIWQGKYRLKGLVSIVLSLVVFLIVGVFLFNTYWSSDFFDFYRLKNLFEFGVNSEFQEGYLSGKYPPLSFDMLIWGTGLSSGVTNDGVIVDIDGGYLRSYSAYGLLGACLLYLVLYLNMIKISISFKSLLFKGVTLFVLLLIILAEYKQPTLYAQYMLGIYIAIIDLFIFTTNNNEKNTLCY